MNVIPKSHLSMQGVMSYKQAGLCPFSCCSMWYSWFCVSVGYLKCDSVGFAFG